MTITIRQYSEEDIEAVLSAWHAASTLAHPFLTSEFHEQVRYDMINLYLPNTDTWVAEIDEAVIGFIALAGNEIGGLFVQPEFHGMGIGKALMDKAHTLHKELEVEVFKKNSIGRKFYSQYGFEFQAESIHSATKNSVLRLKFIA
ncbi:GNAT family N-acetyltransferase [uncultured Amphritea sp.]|uniref:GNAT family N-acetyltransferase n=1 Tax=uncultured Amphritea sp. TaxID=981605 RepID=UPI002624F365|nr:GNAT family N-acetyltransferase [uncultured Amphritea sp.]